MTPKENYFEQIDDYCLNLLDAMAKAKFEAELKLDAELRKEVKLRKEIQEAISEMDVANLRGKLENVRAQTKTRETQKESFELFKDFSNFKELEEELSSEELVNYFDSMPKVHVYQHEMTANENIHHFYKEQSEMEMEDEFAEFDDLDMDFELEGLEEAILEKDIIEFRQNLRQVAKSIEPQYTVEEIDNYLNDELGVEEWNEFEKELMKNSSLKNELMLHQELEKAVKESEIMNLRSKVSNIMETETSWNVSEQSIEEFIEGDLEGELLREFKAELAENSDLMAEVELRKQVNEVIGEIDIRELKASLKAAKDMVEESKVRRFIPETNNKVFKFLRVSAAIMVLLLGIASLLNSGYISSDNAYVNFFESPSWASERSVSADFSFMKKAQAAYINEDFQTVFEMKKEAPESMLNNPVFLFYTGASMQNLNKYAEAVKEYTKVINHGDNMYIEEARWYRSLCYIKLDDMDKAKQELLAVINRNGYYTQEAKAIMRRLRFSLE